MYLRWSMTKQSFLVYLWLFLGYILFNSICVYYSGTYFTIEIWWNMKKTFRDLKIWWKFAKKNVIYFENILLATFQVSGIFLGICGLSVFFGSVWVEMLFLALLRTAYWTTNTSVGQDVPSGSLFCPWESINISDGLKDSMIRQNHEEQRGMMYMHLRAFMMKLKVSCDVGSKYKFNLVYDQKLKSMTKIICLIWVICSPI